MEPPDLIFHQGFEWFDHKCSARLQQGGNLKTERFSASSGSDRKDILTRQGSRG